jgi:hypothetical protein
MFDSETGSLTISSADYSLQLRWVATIIDTEIEATLSTPHLRATHRFHDLPGIYDFKNLANLLIGLAPDWRGFEGDRSWSSIDGDFAITCTHNHVGRVRIAIYLRDYGEEWKLDGIAVEVELGQLDRLASDTRRFIEARPADPSRATAPRS